MRISRKLTETWHIWRCHLKALNMGSRMIFYLGSSVVRISMETDHLWVKLLEIEKSKFLILIGQDLENWQKLDTFEDAIWKPLTWGVEWYFIWDAPSCEFPWKQSIIQRCFEFPVFEIRDFDWSRSRKLTETWHIWRCHLKALNMGSRMIFYFGSSVVRISMETDHLWIKFTFNF